MVVGDEVVAVHVALAAVPEIVEVDFSTNHRWAGRAVAVAHVSLPTLPGVEEVMDGEGEIAAVVVEVVRVVGDDVVLPSLVDSHDVHIPHSNTRVDLAVAVALPVVLHDDGAVEGGDYVAGDDEEEPDCGGVKEVVVHPCHPQGTPSYPLSYYQNTRLDLVTSPWVVEKNEEGSGDVAEQQ